MKNQGTVIARDIHAHKIKLVQDTVDRLGLSIVKQNYMMLQIQIFHI